MTSCVIIVPDDKLAEANAFGASQGWGDDNFTVPLSASGAAPATYWGCRADVGPGFIALLQDPPHDVAVLLAELVIDLRETDQPRVHFLEVIQQNKLSIVEDGLEEE